MEVSVWVGVGSLLGSFLAAFLAGRAMKQTKTSGPENVGEIVESMRNRHRRRTEVFVRAHVEGWELPRLLKELVVADFNEAEREDIFRSKTNWESIE